jgi:DNA polymerase III subunit beta
MTTMTAPTTVNQRTKTKTKRNLTTATAITPVPDTTDAELRLTCAQADLKLALTRINHAIPSKSSVPVLSNVLLASDGERLKLTATDLSIAVTVWISANVSATGTTTLPAKLLSDIVGHLPSDTITLALHPRNQTTQLTCGKFEASIKGIEADAFPTIPTMAERTAVAEFAPEALRETIRQVAGAAANNDTRPVLAGMLIRLEGSEATFVAADGFRMAVRTLPLATAVIEPLEVIVPASCLRELGRLLSDVSDTVAMTIAPTQGHVLFATHDMELMTRVIEGKYPDYTRIIPTSFVTRTVVETAALQQAARLAGFIAASGSKSVRLAMQRTASGGTLTIHATAAEVGDNTGAIEATITGEAGAILLNANLLADAISAVGTPQIAIEMQTPRQAAVLKPVGADGYLHLIMPIAAQ